MLRPWMDTILDEPRDPQLAGAPRFECIQNAFRRFRSGYDEMDMVRANVDCRKRPPTVFADFSYGGIHGGPLGGGQRDRPVAHTAPRTSCYPTMRRKEGIPSLVAPAVASAFVTGEPSAIAAKGDEVGERCLGHAQY